MSFLPGWVGAKHSASRNVSPRAGGPGRWISGLSYSLLRRRGCPFPVSLKQMNQQAGTTENAKTVLQNFHPRKFAEFCRALNKRFIWCHCPHQKKRALTPRQKRSHRRVLTPVHLSQVIIFLNYAAILEMNLPVTGKLKVCVNLDAKICVDNKKNVSWETSKEEQLWLVSDVISWRKVEIFEFWWLQFSQ